MIRSQNNDQPIGYNQIALTVVASLTIPSAAGKPGGGASFVLITPETNGIRWRDDGTDPTAAIGYPLAAGQELQYSGDLSKFRYISQTGTATVNCAYYGAAL